MNKVVLPPYGKTFYLAEQQGYVYNNSIYVWLGVWAWKKASAPNFIKRSMILPPWHLPSKYYWPVKHCDVLIIDTSWAPQEYVETLVYCLYKHGALVVRYLSPINDLTVYHKEDTHEQIS